MSEFLNKIKEALILTLKKLEEKEVYINNLNVFPIPDGDTGTNMCKTLKDTIESKENLDVKDFLNYVKEKIILKAHGNSGIIFSQFLKGFLDEILQADSDDFEKLKKGFEVGFKSSYEVLDNPVEGTIITVIRDAKDALKESKSFDEGIRNAYFKGVEALRKTPELLFVLKEAGVVDAGGEGFVLFLESLLYSFLKERYEREEVRLHSELLSFWRKKPNYRYCVEIYIKKKGDFVLQRSDLKKYGNSIILLEDKDNIKIHIHTNVVDEFINYVKSFGEIEEILSRDMRKQQLRFLHDIQIATVTFSIGDKLTDLFYSLGATVVIEIDEKPSVEEIFEVVQDVPSRDVIILPIDQDLFLTIKEVKEKSSKRVEYIELNSIVQCIEALINFNSSLSFEENLKKMSVESRKLKSGIIAKANKEISFNQIEIKPHEFFGTLEKEIVIKGKDLVETTINLFKKLDIKGGDLYLIYGESIDFNEIELLRFEIQNYFKEINLIIYNGGQKIYDLIYGYKN